MSKVYDGIDDTLAGFIAAQHMFFVATAPLDAGGHLNLSPKGLEGLRVIDSRTVAYLDLTGSGIETVAHLRENGRIVILLCAFDGAPKILRLYGRGEVIEPGDPRFEELRKLFREVAGARAIIVVSLERVADSCGYGIPIYQYEGERNQLIKWAQHKGHEGLVEYRAGHNESSIDGLPGLRTAEGRGK